MGRGSGGVNPPPAPTVSPARPPVQQRDGYLNTNSFTTETLPMISVSSLHGGRCEAPLGLPRRPGQHQPARQEDTMENSTARANVTSPNCPASFAAGPGPAPPPLLCSHPDKDGPQPCRRRQCSRGGTAPVQKAGQSRGRGGLDNASGSMKGGGAREWDVVSPGRPARTLEVQAAAKHRLPPKCLPTASPAVTNADLSWGSLENVFASSGSGFVPSQADHWTLGKPTLRILRLMTLIQRL